MFHMVNRATIGDGLRSTSSWWLHRWEHVDVCDVTNHFLEYKNQFLLFPFFDYLGILIYSESFGILILVFFSRRNRFVSGNYHSKWKMLFCYRSQCVLFPVNFICLISAFFRFFSSVKAFLSSLEWFFSDHFSCEQILPEYFSSVQEKKKFFLVTVTMWSKSLSKHFFKKNRATDLPMYFVYNRNMDWYSLEKKYQQSWWRWPRSHKTKISDESSVFVCSKHVSAKREKQAENHREHVIHVYDLKKPSLQRLCATWNEREEDEK